MCEPGDPGVWPDLGLINADAVGRVWCCILYELLMCVFLAVSYRRLYIFFSQMNDAYRTVSTWNIPEGSKNPELAHRGNRSSTVCSQFILFRTRDMTVHRRGSPWFRFLRIPVWCVLLGCGFAGTCLWFKMSFKYVHWHRKNVTEIRTAILLWNLRTGSAGPRQYLNQWPYIIMSKYSILGTSPAGHALVPRRSPYRL
jgi:hypothetical protein